MANRINLADKETLDQVNVKAGEIKTSVGSIQSDIGSKAGGKTLFERVSALETALVAMQTVLDNMGSVISGSLDLSKINSDTSKPLNVYFLETVYALRVNDESIDWIFRQTEGVGAFLWHYFGLPENVRAEMEGLPDISAVSASATAMAAVSASVIAMNAIGSSAIARAAIKNSAQAYKVILDTDMAVCKYAYGEAGGNPSEYDDIAALTKSEAAMGVLAKSTVAMNALSAQKVARDAINAKSSALSVVQGNAMAIGKFAAGCAGLTPSSYADIAAVASATAAMSAIVKSSTAKTAIIAQNSILQAQKTKIWNTVVGDSNKFTLARSQTDSDGVSNANISGSNYIVFAIPGGYNSGAGTTICYHGHNGSEAARASGSYTDTTKRYVMLGGATFTESGDGEVRTWVYQAK